MVYTLHTWTRIKRGMSGKKGAFIDLLGRLDRIPGLPYFAHLHLGPNKGKITL